MEKAKEAFEKTIKLVEQLRKECHYDKKQTIQSYIKNLTDEAKEAAEAVEKNDADNLKEELGDVLWNILFIANIAKENGLFDIQEILEDAHKKMVRRHPHVFVKKTDNDAEVWKMYSEVKAKEKEQKAKRQIRHIHKPLKGIKAVVFDWDGTIYDSLPFTFEVYKVLEKTIGKKIVPEFHGDHFELDWHLHFKKAGLLTEENIGLAEETYKKMALHDGNTIKSIKGMLETIKKIRENNPEIKFAIASNGHKDNISKRLKEFNATDLFFPIVDAYDVKNKKPYPDSILKCLEKLGVKPEEAVFIGDMDGDIAAGKAAGVKTIAVTFGYHSINRLSKENPDYIIGTPEELLHIIK